MIAKVWVDLCWKKLGRQISLRRQEERRLAELVEEHSEAQVAWAIDAYLEHTSYPSIADLSDFLASISWEFPDELSCRAWQSGDPTLVDLGNELEALHALWFPDAQVYKEIERVESKIRRGLPI